MLEYFLGAPLAEPAMGELDCAFGACTQGKRLRLRSGLRNVGQARAFRRLFEVWPIYLREDWTQSWLSVALFARYPHFQYLVFADERPVGYVATVPVHVPTDARQLDDAGYTWAIAHALAPPHSPRNALCALAAVLHPEFTGSGLSHVLVAALKAIALRHGYHRLVAPVRPTHKHRQPEISMERYVEQRNADGAPRDAWLRCHLRSGARIRNVCRRSIVIRASVKRWQRWLGQSVSPQASAIPGGLAPLHVETTRDRATYREPNVWVDYDLRRGLPAHPHVPRSCPPTETWPSPAKP